MKISILSMQRVVNFGSVLQAWSLRQLLQEMSGETVSFTDIDAAQVIATKEKNTKNADYETPAVYANSLVQKAKRRMIAWLSAYNKKKIRGFMQKELKLDSGAVPEQPDLLVVGSDEVFNHSRGINLQLHGMAPAVKKITYAAACGSASAENIPEEAVSVVRQAMAEFSAISVRDAATRQYVGKLYDGTVENHLDPVLVGNLYLRKSKKVPLKNYVLVYAYGQRIRTAEEIRAIQDFAHRRKLKTVAMGGSQFWCDLYIPASPFRLLDYFAAADYVVTDTFHGTVFSVLQKRRFAVLVRKTNENKLSDLLARLELSDHRVTDLSQLSQVLEKTVDYEKIEKMLQKEREQARDYLKQQLGV